MAEEKNTFREIEHTADLGIEVEATDLPSLFASAGEALYGLIADPSGMELKEELEISAAGEGWEELFHSWLCELLAQFNLKGFVGKRCEVIRLEPGCVDARVQGEILDLDRHRFHTEIKGVTYHGLKIWQKNSTWHARVIFDV
ncbi:MAG: archease [Candidatus Binatia bacterium]